MGMLTVADDTSFADVYEEHLDGVWRFVRARIRDHHHAQDVTSEVFVRAWRSWDRFDPARGRVEPWLFTIARRTVVDWWRRRRPEHTELEEGTTVDLTDLTPEEQLLQEELLAKLSTALADLEPRERDALAMRFAARLKVDDIAEVLGATPGATKMVIHRAITKLRDRVTAAAPAPEVADLEAVIDDVLARGTAAMDRSELHGMLVHLAEVQSAPVPEDLDARIRDCVACEIDAPGSGATVSPDGSDAPRGRKAGLAGVALSIFGLLPVCLACTVPAMGAVLYALGLGAASYWVHLAGVAAAPIVLWLVGRSASRHGDRRGLHIVRAGAVVLIVHVAMHLHFHIDLGWEETTAWFGPMFEITDQAGTGLLTLGAFVNLVAVQRWRNAEAAKVAALPIGPLPTA